MEKNELDNLKMMIDDIVTSKTKKDGKILYDKLYSNISYFENTLCHYSFMKLIDVISIAKDVSGRVRNKTHKKIYMEQLWYKFHTSI